MCIEHVVNAYTSDPLGAQLVNMSKSLAMLVHQHARNLKGKYNEYTKNRLNDNHNCCGNVVGWDSTK